MPTRDLKTRKEEIQQFGEDVLQAEMMLEKEKLFTVEILEELIYRARQRELL